MGLFKRNCKYVLLYYTNDFNHRDPSKTTLWHGEIPVYSGINISIYYYLLLFIFERGTRLKLTTLSYIQMHAAIIL